MDENQQLKLDNRNKDRRIDCLVRAEQSMLVVPAEEIEARDRMEEENLNLKQKFKECRDQVKERDVYLEATRKKETEMKNKLAELEKRFSDQALMMEEQKGLMNRHRNEMNGMKSAKDKELEQLRQINRQEMDKVNREIREMKMKTEKMTVEIIKKEEERKVIEENRERWRITCVRLNAELEIEKERMKKIGTHSQTQTELTLSEVEDKEKQFKTLAKEFADYRTMMEKQKSDGIEQARSNIKYWQDRARKAEAAAKKKHPLSSIENRASD